jgi:putative membrane protein
MTLVDDGSAKRIEATIARIEQRTAAEFVVAVIPRSADYDRWRAIIAFIWAVAAAGIYFRFVPWGGEAWGLLLELPVAALAWAALGLGAIRRLLVPAREAEQAVRAAAFRIFAERGLHRTKDRTGVLLLVSELERRVVILGDSGIHGRVGDQGWAGHVEHLVSRIKESRTTDGIIEVLEALEGVLASELPVSPHDVDELSNRVIRE